MFSSSSVWKSSSSSSIPSPSIFSSVEFLSVNRCAVATQICKKKTLNSKPLMGLLGITQKGSTDEGRGRSCCPPSRCHPPHLMRVPTDHCPAWRSSLDWPPPWSLWASSAGVELGWIQSLSAHNLHLKQKKKASELQKMPELLTAEGRTGTDNRSYVQVSITLCNWTC